MLNIPRTIHLIPLIPQDLIKHIDTQQGSPDRNPLRHRVVSLLTFFGLLIGLTLIEE